MRRLLIALALIATPAYAQGTEDEPQAAPGSIAEGMIEGANASGVFELVHNGQVSVRHVQSGMRCDFERDGAGGRLILYPNLPRGDDVACDWNDGREFITVYATRYPFNSSLQEQLDGAEAAIRNRFGDAVRFPGAVELAAENGLPLRRVTRFIVMRNGERYYTSASVARVGSWILKLRFSTPAADDAAAHAADERANLYFASVLDEIINAPAR